MSPLAFAFPVLWAIALKVLLWLVAFSLSVPFILIYAGYRNNLLQKRDALNNLMSQKGVFASYQTRFGSARDQQNQIVEGLFNLYYHYRTYWLALGLNVAVITIGVAVSMMRQGIQMGLPVELHDLSSKVPLTFCLGFAGAYILSLYDVLRGSQRADLSAHSLHFTWVHMILAAFLATLTTKVFADSIAPAFAFGIGLLPIRDSIQWIIKSTKKRLEVQEAEEMDKGPALSLIQGLNKEVIDRLNDEGIGTTVALAFYDPIKLFLKTNFQWAWVIDVMDQAILINYVGDKIDTLRLAGIRGAIDMTVLGESARGSGTIEQRVASVTRLVATRMSITEEEARNLGDSLYEDGQVDLIWQLYRPFEEAPAPKPSEDNSKSMVLSEEAKTTSTASPSAIPPPAGTENILNQRVSESTGGVIAKPDGAGANGSAQSELNQQVQPDNRPPAN